MSELYERVYNGLASLGEMTTIARSGTLVERIAVADSEQLTDDLAVRPLRMSSWLWLKGVTSCFASRTEIQMHLCRYNSSCQSVTLPLTHLRIFSKG